MYPYTQIHVNSLGMESFATFVSHTQDEMKRLITTVTGAAAPLTYGFGSPNVMVDCPSNL